MEGQAKQRATAADSTNYRFLVPGPAEGAMTEERTTNELWEKVSKDSFKGQTLSATNDFYCGTNRKQ